MPMTLEQDGMMVCAGQRWTRKRDGTEVRVMAVVEGWVMVRFKGAVPFISFWKEFQRNYMLTSGEAA